MTRPALSPEQLLEDACRRFRCSAWAMFRRNPWGQLYRDAALVRCRGVVWAWMVEHGCSYPEVALACGLKTHSTVVSGVRRFWRNA